MKNNILFKLLLISIIFNISCKKEKQNILKLPKSADIDAIIETVIYSDSLPIVSNLKSTKAIPFCVDLKKIKIIQWNAKTHKIHPRMRFNEITIQKLIGYENLPSKFFFFNKTDSLYIEFQNENLSNYKISKSLSSRFLTTNFELIKKQKTNKQFIYIYSTIPIISLNGKKAYLELSIKCIGLCGTGYEIYLEKINGKWTISNYRKVWES